MERIPGGYYIKAKKIQTSVIAHAPPHVREIWDWLLQQANFKDVRYNGFIIKRGQLFRTYKEIREGLHWMVGYRKMTYNENHTKKAMKFLREAHMIDSTKELGGVLITILNYDYYQNSKNYERTSESTNERTNEEPMRNHPLPDNKNKDKNDKNEKKKDIYGEFVLLSKDQHKNLLKDFGESNLNKMIEKLDLYLGADKKRLKKYTSHNHVLRGWVAEGLGIMKNGDKGKSIGHDNSFLRGIQELRDKGELD